MLQIIGAGVTYNPTWSLGVMVNTLPCQGREYGFESRNDRPGGYSLMVKRPVVARKSGSSILLIHPM